MVGKINLFPKELVASATGSLNPILSLINIRNMHAKHNKQLGLYVILLDGNYNLLKWNKALVPFGYRIDIIHLDEFELKFGSVFELEPTDSLLQNIPITFTDAGKRPCTIYISSAFEQKIRTQYPRYISLLEKGYVVLLKTFKKLPVYSRQQITSDEVMEHMLTTYQFCKNFTSCVQLTAGTLFKPVGYFAHIMEDTTARKDRIDKQFDLPVKIEVIKKGNYFMMDFPL
jgi:hypothetical protein